MKTQAYKIIKKAIKGYIWSFDSGTGFLWLINLENKEWLLVLHENNVLWYYKPKFDAFFEEIEMKHDDYQEYITSYIEEILETSISYTEGHNPYAYIH